MLGFEHAPRSDLGSDSHVRGSISVNNDEAETSFSETDEVNRPAEDSSVTSTHGGKVCYIHATSKKNNT